MGNESSNDLETNINSDNILPTNLNSIPSSLVSSYNTMHIDNTNDLKSNTNIQHSDSTINFKFEWTKGGNEVLIIGDFNEWKNFIPLRKNLETNIFEEYIKVTKQKHSFKFKVDGEWKCSENYGLTKDNNNNTNNFIDLSNYNQNQENNVNKNGKGRPYDCERRERSDMNADPSHIPFHFSQNFRLDLNTFQDFIKTNNDSNEKYLTIEKENLLTENNSYKNIYSCPHEKLGHCLYECQDNLINNKINYLRTCCTERIKHKELTLIYYRPKYKEQNDKNFNQ